MAVNHNRSSGVLTISHFFYDDAVFVIGYCISHQSLAEENEPHNGKSESGGSGTGSPRTGVLMADRLFGG